MSDKTTKDLRDIEKAVVRLRNKMKRVDMNYTVQVSINSTDPQTVIYASQITSPATGLAPVTFIAKTAEELVKKIKGATKHIDLKQIEIAYHQAQIKSAKRTIEGHEDRIEELSDPANNEFEEVGKQLEPEEESGKKTSKKSKKA